GAKPLPPRRLRGADQRLVHVSSPAAPGARPSNLLAPGDRRLRTHGRHVLHPVGRRPPLLADHLCDRLGGARARSALRRPCALLRCGSACARRREPPPGGAFQQGGPAGVSRDLVHAAAPESLFRHMARPHWRRPADRLHAVGEQAAGAAGVRCVVSHHAEPAAGRRPRTGPRVRVDLRRPLIVLRALLFVLTLAPLLVGCITEPALKRPHDTQPVELDDGWAVAASEDVGLSADAVEAVYRRFFSEREFYNALSLLVVRDGRLVAEGYARELDDRFRIHNAQSITKSVT